MKYQFTLTIIIGFILLWVSQAGCKKFVEVDSPRTQITTPNVYSTDATATSAILGIYSQMTNSNSAFASGGPGSITMLAGLSADEFINYGNQIAFQTNSLDPTNPDIQNYLWNPAYNLIYDANAVLAGLNSSKTISQSVNRQLQGEAKFIRAFCNFYLVNLFGDIPLITGTDYNINKTSARTSVNDVYNQITNDLMDAQDLLADDYSISNSERVRPNKWAAAALLARVRLYLGDWAGAESASTSVINNTGLYNLVPNLDSVFLMNSNEAIWQLFPVNPGNNTNEGQIFVLTGAPTFVALTNNVLDAFETGDKRKDSWIDSVSDGITTYYFPFKYKKGTETVTTVTEYYMVFRLAEQYLIRAEARAHQNSYSGSLSDLNIIRNRAGLSSLNIADQQSLLSAIEQERRVELFAEFGHRWFDLKRTSRADAVFGVEKNGWKSTDALYPIPQPEISNDPMLTQNPGY